MLKNIAKFAVMAGIPSAIVYGLGFIIWPSVYITLPVFFPFAPYSKNTENWTQTIFHTANYGWHFFIGYSVLVAVVAVWISREKSWPMSLVIYGLVCVAASIVVHVLLHMLGYHYYMDAP